MSKFKKFKTVTEVFAEEEISLLEIIRLYVQHKKYLYISTAIFFIMGILIAITSPIEYIAQSRILSEDGDQSNSSLNPLSGLAGLAGFNIPTSRSTTSLSPGMYPSIISSEPFLMDLMQERFFFQEKNQEMSIYEYFNEEQPGHIFSKLFSFLGGIPKKFFRLFEREKEWDIPIIESEESSEVEVVDDRKPRIVHITRADENIIAQLTPRIEIEAEERIITLGVKMPEPYISAELNTIVLQKVIDYVVAYKTDKQRENLKFIEERFSEAERNFKAAQLRLASFKDANVKIVSEKARAREQQLDTEFDLAFNLYKKLAQELEQTKIQLKRETPLFTEFEPVSIPLTKAEPNVPFIVIKYLILGILVGLVAVTFVLAKEYVREYEK